MIGDTSPEFTCKPGFSCVGVTWHADHLAQFLRARSPSRLVDVMARVIGARFTASVRRTRTAVSSVCFVTAATALEDTLCSVLVHVPAAQIVVERWLDGPCGGQNVNV